MGPDQQYVLDKLTERPMGVAEMSTGEDALGPIKVRRAAASLRKLGKVYSVHKNGNETFYLHGSK